MRMYYVGSRQSNKMNIALNFPDTEVWRMDETLSAALNVKWNLNGVIRRDEFQPINTNTLMSGKHVSETRKMRKLLGVSILTFHTQ